MRLGLVSMGYVPFVRRRMRAAGFWLSVRHGSVYTMEAVEIRQPNSDAQLRARDLLIRANELAAKDMSDPERRLYWTTHAAEMGYKTAVGACRAHHIKRLKEMDLPMPERREKRSEAKCGEKAERGGGERGHRGTERLLAAIMEMMEERRGERRRKRRGRRQGAGRETAKEGAGGGISV